MRGLLTTFVNALLGAEADAVCGAAYGSRSLERTNSRNGYRHRDLDTRVGTIDVAIPKLRSGSYFPDWLLERRRRAEAALTSVVATCYLLGVSTRRTDKLVQSLGITGLSKSQVSVMARDLDAHVADFRTRPLDAGPYTFVAADALTMRVREGGRVVKVAVLVATGVNADGHREVLGIQVNSGETHAGWLAFFRDLVARGLSGVALVTSDAHAGLVEAIGAPSPGAAWQRRPLGAATRAAPERRAGVCGDQDGRRCAWRARAIWRARGVRSGRLPHRPRLDLHRDAFTKLWRRQGIRRSMAGAGSCVDDAAAEEFFSSLEWEVLSRHEFENLPQAQSVVLECCLGFDIHDRRHSSAGMISPVNYENTAVPPGKPQREALHDWRDRRRVPARAAWPP